VRSRLRAVPRTRREGGYIIPWVSCIQPRDNAPASTVRFVCYDWFLRPLLSPLALAPTTLATSVLPLNAKHDIPRERYHPPEIEGEEDRIPQANAAYHAVKIQAQRSSAASSPLRKLRVLIRVGRSARTTLAKYSARGDVPAVPSQCPPGGE